jgi:hypothetical protein
MNTRQIAPIVCPRCHARFTAEVETIIDVGQNPELKAHFIQGQINGNTCPQCGYKGAMIAPLFYHDSQKELALVLLPGELALPHDEQQRLIGSFTNLVMSSLPPEKRKAYLFQPKMFLTYQSLVNAVLEADGVTPEMIQAQNKRIKLLQEFAGAKDQAELEKTIEANAALLDKDFFEIITISLINAQQEGNSELVELLYSMRQAIAEHVAEAKAWLTEIDKAFGLVTLNREELLDRLQNASSQEEFEQLVIETKQMLDYSFFQDLTGRIEKAEKEGQATDATALKDLRNKIMDVTMKLEEEARRTLQEKAELLRQLISGTNQQEFIVKNINKFDDAFFALMMANIESAKAKGLADTADKLQKLGDEIIRTIKENIPPELKLINQLLQAKYPEETAELMSAQKQYINDEFMLMLDELVQSFQSNSQPDFAGRITELKQQAEQIKILVAK